MVFVVAIAQPIDERREAAVFTAVVLHDVAGHDHLAPEADARHKHQQLVGRAVLRLVGDDPRIGKGPAAHEGQGRDLDGPALEQPVDVGRRQSRVAHGVRDRVQPRHHLVVERSREVPDVLVGGNDGSRDDHPLELAVEEAFEAHGRRDARLSRARGTLDDHDGRGLPAQDAREGFLGGRAKSEGLGSDSGGHDHGAEIMRRRFPREDKILFFERPAAGTASACRPCAR